MFVGLESTSLSMTKAVWGSFHKGPASALPSEELCVFGIGRGRGVSDSAEQDESSLNDQTHQRARLQTLRDLPPCLAGLIRKSTDFLRLWEFDLELQARVAIEVHISHSCTVVNVLAQLQLPRAAWSPWILHFVMDGISKLAHCIFSQQPETSVQQYFNTVDMPL